MGVPQFSAPRLCVGFSIAQVQHYARQLVKAVKFCHDIKLVHTDLKPENILFQ